MEDILGVLTGALAIVTLFIGLPWLIMHYVTKWKTAATLSGSDEQLLEELYDLARKLDDRLCSIERIMTAENPNWRQQCLPDAPRLTASEADMDLDQELARLSARRQSREMR